MASMNPASVVIRTVGTQEKLPLLRQLLNSLSRQSFKNFELVIATESNHDAVRKLVDTYLKNIDTTIIETGMWNRCKTTNQGIRAAKGEFIALLDDDFMLGKEWLGKLLTTLDALPPSVGCISSIGKSADRKARDCKTEFFATVTRVADKLSIPGSLWKKRRKVIGKGLLECITFGGTHVIFRRNILLKIGMYDEDMEEPMFGDDLNLALKMHKSGCTSVVDCTCQAYHLEEYVPKQFYKDAHYFENCCLTELYVYAKHFDVIGLYILPQMIFRVMWGLSWGFRTRNPRMMIHCARGVARGLAKRLS